MTYTPTTRLPHQGHETPQARRSDILKGIAAIIGTLLVVVGLPIGLAAFLGNPFADFASEGLALFSRGLDSSLVLQVFIIVLWLAWAYFTVSLVLEFVRWFRNKRRYGTGLGPGGAGILTRRLVASMMLLFSASSFAPSFQSLTAPSGAQAAAEAEIQREMHEVAIVEHNMAVQNASFTMQGSVGDSTGKHTTSDGTVISYVVQPQQGRHYDTLWDIAERYLGDGMRYKEIFELNRDKEQADGSRLRDADLILPGWTLELPADAKGPGLQIYQAAPAPAVPGGSATGGGSSANGGGSVEEAAGDSTDAESIVARTTTGSTATANLSGLGAGAGSMLGDRDDSAQGSGDEGPGAAGAEQDNAEAPRAAGTFGTADSRDSGTPGLLTAAELAEHREGAQTVADLTAAAPGGVADDVRHAVGGGLLVAGILMALSARRGPYGAVQNERMLRLAENGRLALDLDRALRYLALGCRETNTPLPEVSMVMAGPETIVLHHSSGAGSAPPWPWRQAEGSTAWIVDHKDIPEDRIDAPAPYPALVNVADTRGYEILVDLEAAPGLISVAGQPEYAREVLMSMAVELATNCWSDGIDVDLVGFGSDLSAIAPTRIHQSASLTEVLDEVAERGRESEELLARMGVDGVLAGRTARGSQVVRPRIVFTSGAPDAEESARIHDLIGVQRVPLAVVSLGNTPASRWKFVVGQDGTLSLDIFRLRGSARRISLEQLEQITHLFRLADTARSAPEAQIDGLDPRAAADQAISHVTTYEEDPSGSTQPSAFQFPDKDPASLQSELTGTPDAVVRILGQVEVVAPGPVDETQRELLTELIAAVALHREGLHDAVLRSIVWPRGVSDDVVAAAVRAAQSWLGRATDGSHRLRQREDGRWELHDVQNEWQLLLDVAHTGFGTAQEIDLFGLLLDRARGEVLSVPDTGGYSWVAFHTARRDARVLLTTIATHAAQKSTAAGNANGAIWFLRRGLTCVPTAESMWRDLLRITGDHNPAELEAVARQMFRTLNLFGVERREAETDSLVQQIVPAVARTRLSA